MTLAEMFAQNTELAILGTILGFGFLVFLVVRAKQKGKTIHGAGADKNAGGSAAPTDSGVLAAVIMAAVNEFRKRG